MLTEVEQLEAELDRVRAASQPTQRLTCAQPVAGPSRRREPSLTTIVLTDSVADSAADLTPPPSWPLLPEWPLLSPTTPPPASPLSWDIEWGDDIWMMDHSPASPNVMEIKAETVRDTDMDAAPVGGKEDSDEDSGEEEEDKEEDGEEEEEEEEEENVTVVPKMWVGIGSR